jgi:hypothetical protein
MATLSAIGHLLAFQAPEVAGHDDDRRDHAEEEIGIMVPMTPSYTFLLSSLTGPLFARF